MNKRLAGTGLAIGLVAGAGAGLIIELAGNANALSGAPAAVVAAVGDSTTDTAATDDGARPDPSTRLQEVLQPLVDDGTITQAQADKVIAALVAAHPMGGPDGGPMGGGHRGHRGLIGQGLDVVATTLDITTDEVRTALQNGQSVADLAVSKGKTAQDVIDALVTEATTKINDKVTAGDMTQAQADELIAGLTTGITAFVNGTPPAGMPGFGPGFGGPFGMGHHGDDNDADDDAPAVVPAAPATTDTVAG